MRIPIAPFSGALLAFVAGYVDTATFLRVSELFFGSHHRQSGRFLHLPCARCQRHRLAKTHRAAGVFPRCAHGGLCLRPLAAKNRIVLGIEASLLIGVAILEFLLHSPAYDAGLAMLLVLAMAMQNAAHLVEPSLGATSAVMTTNATRLFVALWRRASPPPVEAPPVKAGGIGARLICFAFGCVISAFAANRFGLAAVLLPGLVVAFVALFHEA